MRFDFDSDEAIGWMFAVVGIVLILLTAGLLVDGAQAIRSYDDKVACRIERLEPVRKPLTTQVVCVPLAERQDTLTLSR